MVHAFREHTGQHWQLALALHITGYLLGMEEVTPVSLCEMRTC